MLMKNRRLAVAVTALFLQSTIPAIHAAPPATKGQAVAPFTPKLKPGQYVWHPEVSPSGPVVLLVSLPDQVMYVYRNGVRIGRSTVSTGRNGKQTPTGVFTILQKKVDHESNIYKGAKMPNMQRLTWSGIALHTGNLPGYPASAGCVRLPAEFAAKLYSVTSIGSTVIIADNNSPSTNTTNPGLLLSGKTANSEGIARKGYIWIPESSPKGPLSIIVSEINREIYVYRSGVEIGRAPAKGLDIIRGTHVYTALDKMDASGMRLWETTASVGGPTHSIKELVKTITVSPGFMADVRALITPGTTLILTDAPVSSQRQVPSGINILTTDR